LQIQIYAHQFIKKVDQHKTPQVHRPAGGAPILPEACDKNQYLVALNCFISHKLVVNHSFIFYTLSYNRLRLFLISDKHESGRGVNKNWKKICKKIKIKKLNNVFVDFYEGMFTILRAYPLS